MVQILTADTGYSAGQLRRELALLLSTHFEGMRLRRARRHGLERVRVEGLLVAFAYNILKATQQMLGPRRGPRGSVS